MTTFANFGEDKYKILKEMKRIVKKNGNILISVYSENAFKDRMNMYKKLKAPIKQINGTTVVFSDSLGKKDNTSEQFSKAQLRTIFSKVGLKVLDIHNIGILNACNLYK